MCRVEIPLAGTAAWWENYRLLTVDRGLNQKGISFDYRVKTRKIDLFLLLFLLRRPIGGQR